MEDILDQPVFQHDKSNIEYGSFWQRVGASLLDTLILAPVSMGVTYFNIVTWKNPLLLIALTLATISYKPFMEATYGATLGKMALKLKVANLEFETASIGEILMRNIFHIVPSLLSLVVSIMVFNDPDFESVSGYGEFAAFSKSYSISSYISISAGLITIIDVIVLTVNQENRSLHDKIGGAVVIAR